MKYTHLLYVRQYSILTNDYELYVFGVNTEDIFHTIGEYYYRACSHVKRIDFVEWSQTKQEFWQKEGYQINEFRNKYPVINTTNKFIDTMTGQ